LRLRLLTTTYLEQAHFFRGEYQRVIELTTDNLAALPAGSDYESFESTGYIAIYNWFSILTSLTEPHPTWPIRRGGSVRSRGAPVHRGNESCVRPR
jgi:hypothetical protein